MVRVEFKTPELIRSLALQLGIRLDPPNDDDTNAGDAGGDGDAQQTGPEYYLLSVANFMVSGPLPPCVERRLAAGDVIKYYDTRSGFRSRDTHCPALWSWHRGRPVAHAARSSKSS